MVTKAGTRFFSSVLILLFLLSTAPLYAAKGFQTGAPTYPTKGTKPFFTLAAVLRSGALPDLIVGDLDVGHNSLGTSSTIEVFINNGDGTYQPAVTYSVCANPAGIAAADFNGDNKMDLAIACAGSGQVAILFGKGDGTFTLPATTYTVGTNPLGIVAGNFFGNNRMDLVVTNSGVFSGGGNTISTLQNTGGGVFSVKSTFSSGGTNPAGITAGDFGNGHLDIAVANSNMAGTGTANAAVFLNNGSGTFGAPTLLSVASGDQPFYIIAAEMAEKLNSNLDLIVSDSDSNGSGGDVAYFAGNGNGTFAPAVFMDAGIGAFGMAVGDFNKDGHLDILTIGNNSKAASLIFGNGDGTFSPAIPVAVGFEGEPTIADLNGDGNLDFAVTNHQSGSSSGPGSLAVLLGDGKGNFPAAITSYPSNGNAQAVATADFNGDAKPDLAVAVTNFNCGSSNCNSTDSYDVLIGQGTGKFAQLPEVSLPYGNALGIVAGAFNNTSAHQDLVVSQNGSGGGGYSYIQGNGDGTFQAPVNTLTGNNVTFNPSCFPFQDAAADLNHDGKLDLLLGGCNSAISTLLGAGNGTFGSPSALGQQAAVGIQSVSGQIAVGALGGTGSTVVSPSDIVVAVPDASNTNINAYVYLDQGGGTYGTPLVLQIGTNANLCGFFCPMGVATGNFVETTNPKFQDIAVTNVVSGTVTILKNNANGTFTAGTPITLGTLPNYIAVGDFNGDGHLDLAVANCGNCNSNSNNDGSGSTISILYGNGDGTFQAPTAATTYIAGNGSVGIAVGDYNGDGAPDLAVANSYGESAAILLNTGGTFANLQSSANPAQFGQNVTFTATFTPSLSSTPTTGTVTFFNGNTAISGAITISNNQAQFSTNTLGLGLDIIIARYSGDSNYNPHRVGLPQTVNKGSSTTTMSAAPNPADVTQPVTLTATVTGGGATPTGNVTFMDGGAPIAAAVALNAGGVATLGTSFSTVATHGLTAVYGGDSNYAGSTSTTYNEVIQVAPTNTAIASGTNPSLAGNAVTFTATVTTGFGTPAGTVNFTATGPAVVTPSNGNSLNISGMATGSLTFVTPGSYSVTATYSGDADHAGSASSPLTQIVNCSTCATTQTLIAQVNATPTRPGEPALTVELRQTVTFTVAVAATSGTTPPNVGTVQLQDNGVNIGPATALTPGAGTTSTAVISVTGFKIGAHNITAVYSGGTGFDASVSAPTTLQDTPLPR